MSQRPEKDEALMSWEEGAQGIMSEDDLKGLERNGTHVVTQIDDEETDTHVTGLSVGVRTRLLVETQRGLCNVRAKHLSY